MKLRAVTLAVSMAYLWLMMILLGAIVLETFMVYPNIFVDPPASLETALEFMRVTAPNDFFPPLGFLSWITGVGAVVLAWRIRPARYWVAFSVLMIVCEGLFSMAFHWPRNEILFVEGTAVHSDAFLVQTAQEFQRLHWSRLVFNAASAVTIFVGFLKVYRDFLVGRSGASLPTPATKHPV
ncbi:hypothetical protein ABN028_03295 [Actinopolymorpha sp. B17G11]|uniref:hypothetical protein n=1 Tax=unclassified Actinopolymorpha TaxID=2627063 RepID=UPI0032D9AC01